MSNLLILTVLLHLLLIVNSMFTSKNEEETRALLTSLFASNKLNRKFTLNTKKSLKNNLNMKLIQKNRDIIINYLVKLKNILLTQRGSLSFDARGFSRLCIK